MPNSTQLQIIQIIYDLGSATAAQISQTLNLTQAAVRYHLDALLKSHEIEVLVEEQPLDRPGHPVRVFRVTPIRRPNNLPHLADILLSLLEDSGTPKAFYKTIAPRLSSEFTPPSTPARRIKETMQFLKARQYQPSWEARPHGPRIRFDNCPYAAVIRDHPGLCQVDTHLLEILTGGECTQVSRVELDLPQRTFCLFDILPSTLSPHRPDRPLADSNRP